MSTYLVLRDLVLESLGLDLLLENPILIDWFRQSNIGDHLGYVISTIDHDDFSNINDRDESIVDNRSASRPKSDYDYSVFNL